MSFTDQEAACFLCGSVQDPCQCMEEAQHHERIQYHRGDSDELRACEVCDRFAEERPEDLDHENGMHAGVLVEDCGACGSMGF